NGDSRVQKAARSAAERGWDVVLVGRSPDDRPRRWRIGGAAVRLIPVHLPPWSRWHELRRAWLRSPLAYPPGPLAEARRRRVRIWRASIQSRAVESRTAGHPIGLRLRLARVSCALTHRWVEQRARRTEALAAARERMVSPLDRFTTWFWLRTMGDRSWRRLDPQLWDYELAFGRTVDKLRPDLIHANDFRMLGVGARAVMRARARGRDVKLVWDAHEYLPGIKPWVPHPRWLPAQCAHEREYSRHADAVVTVSESLGDLLVERHGLAERPTVVLNAPDVAARVEGEVPDLRERCGIGPDTPLVVYSGAAAPQRGLDVMVEALPELADSHLALIVLKPGSRYVRGLVARAKELGVNGRLHVLPYVPHDQVVPFLAGADVGVIPIHHWPNHEIALITKFFEYSHARLPVVVSDVRTMAETVRETGQGEVFEAEDLAGYVRAVREVLDAPERYRKVYDDPELLRGWTWDAQADVLDGVYRGLIGKGKR
ncbi:MAG: glycosyltransferase family 4 protein, partial [Nonomuraea sp.]|nr:glycosyltransferase family 4 protein [Nonomuraea sp.]